MIFTFCSLIAKKLRKTHKKTSSFVLLQILLLKFVFIIQYVVQITKINCTALPAMQHYDTMSLSKVCVPQQRYRWVIEPDLFAGSFFRT